MKQLINDMEIYFIVLGYFFFLFYYYLLINKKIINLYVITLTYITIAFYVGIWTFDVAKLLVNPFNEDFLESAILLYNISFFSILSTLLLVVTIEASQKNRQQTNLYSNLSKYVISDVPFSIILFFSIPIVLVFITIYIPVFQDNISVSKYFQDRIAEFIKYRPFYTLSINLLSIFLFMQLANLIVSHKRRLPQLLKIIFLILLLIGTGKRGQLFFPVFLIGLSYYMYKKKYFTLLGLFFGTVLLGSLLRMNSLMDFFNVSLYNLYQSFSSSFFVSIRELTRLLSFFDENFLYGLTYIAGFISFVPTAINPFKEEYNYMRYITYLSGENPDLFGGMRATFIGEAFINFGVIGVILISIMFGFLLFYLQRIISKHTIYKSFEYYLLLFLTFKMVILPLFENGSAMFLFFLITISGFFIVNIANRIGFKGK